MQYRAKTYRGFFSRAVTARRPTREYSPQLCSSACIAPGGAQAIAVMASRIALRRGFRRMRESEHAHAGLDRSYDR